MLPKLTIDELIAAIDTPDADEKMVIAPITVALAERLLDNYAPTRPLNRRRVTALAKALTRHGADIDQAELDHVAIAANGQTFKGQHLLHAIVISGKDLNGVRVELNVPPVEFVSVREQGV
jgi:hypothetical protein